MTVIDLNGCAPAYPVTVADPAHLTGLTKRELFAAMALQGLLARADHTGNYFDEAVYCADRLLQELAK